MKCSPDFIERAIYEECGVPYYKMLDSKEEKDRCRLVTVIVLSYIGH